MRRSLGHLGHHDSIDELDPIVFRQDAHLGHALVLVNGEAVEFRRRHPRGRGSREARRRRGLRGRDRGGHEMAPSRSLGPRMRSVARDSGRVARLNAIRPGRRGLTRLGRRRRGRISRRGQRKPGMMSSPESSSSSSSSLGEPSSAVDPAPCAPRDRSPRSGARGPSGSRPASPRAPRPSRWARSTSTARSGGILTQPSGATSPGNRPFLTKETSGLRTSPGSWGKHW